MMHRMDPLTIPAADRVISIETRFEDFSDQRTMQHNKSITLSNPGKITAVIGVLKELNTEMRKAVTTYPTPTHTVVITDKDNLGLVVFIGKNWFGGRNNVDGEGGMNRLRVLSDEQRTLLLHSVSVGE